MKVYNKGTRVAKKEAEDKGYEIVHSDDCTLLLDLDDQASVDRFEQMYKVLEKAFKVEAKEVWKSKSGNTHVKVQLSQAVPLHERIALQAILGSDPNREMLSLVDIRKGEQFPVMLFKPQEELV